MTTVANAVQSVDLTGAPGGSSIREDLANIITNVDPTDTPFFSMAQRASATSVLHEWWTDAYEAAALNRHIEAEDATAIQGNPRTRLNNRIQISTKVPLVSDIADLVDTSPISREMAHQVAKMTIELRRDIEFELMGVGNAKVSGTDSVAAEAANVGSWVATNGTRTGGAALDNTGDGTDVPTLGANRTFTEAILTDEFSNIWTESGPMGANTILFTNSTLKPTINTFTGISTETFHEAADKSILNAVDVYVSDYGDVRVVLDRHQPIDEVKILDMQYWAVTFLGGGPVMSKPLSVSGDYTKTMLKSYWTLESRAEKASAQILDLDP